MGSYLSEPVVDKDSTDESNDKLNCGASSMQGWRVSQEDAHNCILDYDTDTSYFAVYDGHGGHEVALYCSQQLPEFLKNLDKYKTGDYKAALEEAFLKFDATIATPEVVAKLKELAGDKDNEASDDEENLSNLYVEAKMPMQQILEKYTACKLKTTKDKDNAECSGDEDVSNLYEEATMPIEQVLEKYNKIKAGNVDYNLIDDKSDGLKASSSGLSTSDKACSSNSMPNCSGDVVSSSSNSKTDEISSSADKIEKCTDVLKEETKENVVSSEGADKVQAPDSSGDTEKLTMKKDEKEIASQNGEVESTQNNYNNKTSVTSSSPQENGEISPKKGKGKALTKTKGVVVDSSNVRSRPRRCAAGAALYSKLLREEESEEDESEDEEDTSFQIPNESSDDADGEEGDDEDDEEDSDDEEDDDEDAEDEESMEFARNMPEEPGSDSGCTAVVALLKGNNLYVANAGDSRCIVCRNGKAIEMSFDHKPEDEPERDRVVKAGGKVTADGRVNGGLNLSRAIGDHAYKLNKELSDREQMITALPDIKELTIHPAEDEFMVLACDGIWNFMSSQEVCDFVRPRLREGKMTVSQICEEMFDHCLAPNTLGDGTGCDNMTAIIVVFKSSLLKRSATESEQTESVCKKAKTEENTSQVESTA